MLSRLFAWRIAAKVRRSTGPDERLEELLRHENRVRQTELVGAALALPDGYLDGVCEGVCLALGVPMASVALIFPDRQEIRGAHGISKARRVLPLEYSICAYVTAFEEPFEFADVAGEPMIRSCLSVGSVGYYAGRPIFFRGAAVGALAVLDRNARDPHVVAGQRMTDRLAPHAAQVEHELEQRVIQKHP